MNQIFTLAIITILYKVIRYIYKVYTFDCSELYKYIENTDKQTVFAAYGHTSFFDVPYIIRASYCTKAILGIAKKKYKWMYPKFTHPYLHFIDKNTKNTCKLQLNKHIGILIEGTRDKMPYIRSGFTHIAKNNNAVIVYWINNYKYNKLQLSSPISEKESGDVILAHLKKFLEGIPKNEYSFYPKYLSEIKYKM